MLVPLLFIVLVCCGVGISCDDINLEAIHLLKHCSEGFSNSMAYTALWSRKTRSGYQLPLFGVIGAICFRPKGVVSWSLPSTADATDSRSAKSCSADRSRDSLTAVSDVLPNLTSKIAACPFLSSTSDSHGRGKNPEDFILVWTDRSLLLFEWHPTKPQSLSNQFASVGKLSASAVKITCA